MNCKKVTKLIPAFIQDELPVRELEMFLEHVDECPECKEELTIQLLVREGLSSLEAGDDFDIKQEIEQKMYQARCRIKWHKELDLLILGIGIVSLCIVILIIIWLVI